MEEERREHVTKMKKMEMEMEQVFEMKVKEKVQKLKDSEAEVQHTHTDTHTPLGSRALQVMPLCSYSSLSGLLPSCECGELYESRLISFLHLSALFICFCRC